MHLQILIALRHTFNQTFSFVLPRLKVTILLTPAYLIELCVSGEGERGPFFCMSPEETLPFYISEYQSKSQLLGSDRFDDFLWNLVQTIGQSSWWIKCMPLNLQSKINIQSMQLSFSGVTWR